MPGSSKLDPFKNHILAALSQEETRRLRPHLQPVSFKLREVLSSPGDPARYVYFPLNAVVSLIATMQGGGSVEVALIGFEGLAGMWAALGAKAYWFEAVTLVPGDCLRIPTPVFRGELKRGGALLDQLHGYSLRLLAQVSQTAACNRVHRLEQRLARWLLMTHDRVEGDEFPVTHEFLSSMLGAERSDVTIAAGALRKARHISYGRGKVRILDREGLESASCECYAVDVGPEGHSR